MVYNYVLDLPSPSKEKLHPEDITAVFDLDDTLWDLSGPVFRKAGTSFGLAVDFALQESPEITAVQRSRIIALFGEVDTFKNIQLYPAVAQLKALYDLGVNVMVKSNCLGWTWLIEVALWLVKNCQKIRRFSWMIPRSILRNRQRAIICCRRYLGMFLNMA